MNETNADGPTDGEQILWNQLAERDEVNAQLRARIAELERRVEERKGRPTIVCLCGSSKWPDIHMRAMMDETLAGRIVIPMGLYGHADFPRGAKTATNDGDESTAVKQMLDTLHHRKIDAADEILVLTVGGYIGSSTKREIEYAEATGKKVRFLDCGGEQPSELTTLRAEVERLTKERDEAKVRIGSPSGPTLEKYLKQNMSFGTIDFAIRSSLDGQNGNALLYIHPSGRDGDTLDFRVEGNSLYPL